MDIDIERHDRLNEVFVYEVVGPAVDTDADYAEVMVIFESVMVSMLEVMQKIFGFSPQMAVEMIDDGLGQAIERFAEANNE